MQKTNLIILGALLILLVACKSQPTHIVIIEGNIAGLGNDTVYPADDVDDVQAEGDKIIGGKEDIDGHHEQPQPKQPAPFQAPGIYEREQDEESGIADQHRQNLPQCFHHTPQPVNAVKASMNFLTRGRLMCSCTPPVTVTFLSEGGTR